MQDIVECVPNISEGRDLATIEAIANVAAATPGVTVLGVEPDADYNRTVITFAGPLEAVEKAAVDLSVAAINAIDMRTHSGEHPRLGAVDVCPFVPIAGVSMADCAAAAKRVAIAVHEQTNAPTFLYGHAAQNDERTRLSYLRKGEYEGLRERLEGGTDRLPDFGHQEGWTEAAARSGGCTYGARPVLVAYNVNIPERDARVAKVVGSLLRGSGRILARNDSGVLRATGMLESVQGMGVVLDAHGISQVSMNLTNVDKHGMLHAFEAVRSLAADHGLDVVGSELVGLVPLETMLEAGRWYAPQANEESDLVRAAVEGLGLNSLTPFDPASRIIEYAIREAAA
jgi:glutamate formiminotransferase